MMADEILDASGLSCPQPAMLTRKYLQGLSGNQGEILVDSATARDNCVRIAKMAGWKVSIEELSDGSFRLLVGK